MRRSLSLLPFLLATSLVGCALASDQDGDPAADTEDELRAKADEEWFYNGPLPTLHNPSITISLKGHTVHVRGTAPATTELPTMPPGKDYFRTKHVPGGRIQIDVVYPTATGADGASLDAIGSHNMYRINAYRPDGTTTSNSNPNEHYVTWGGFPFLGYSGNYGMHGPITIQDNKGSPDADVFYLRRGPVSGGCNRMNGEHVTELAHLIGMSMQRLWAYNRWYTGSEIPHTPVKVINTHDMLGDKLIDVDYPTDDATDNGAIRPKGNVVMFGSWIATEFPKKKTDMPQDQAGLKGRPYVFADHAVAGAVCSVPRALLPALKDLAGRDGLVPKDLCAKKQCIVPALKAGGAALARSKCDVK